MNLNIDLIARFAQFQDALDQVSRHASKSVSQIDKAFGALRGTLATLGVGLSIAGIGSFAKSVLDGIAVLDDLAEKTGASVEELSKLEQVARIGGHSIEVAETAMIRLTKALHGGDEEAKGAGKALAALGLSADELRKKDTAEALRIIAIEMNKYADGSGKTALALDLLGKGGAQALAYLKDLATEQGIASRVTTEQAAAAEELQKSLKRLANESRGAAEAIARDLIPILSNLLEQMREGTKISGGFWSGLMLIMRTNALKDFGLSLKETREQLAGLEQDRLRQLKSGPVDVGGLDLAIADGKKRIELLKLQQRQEALALGGTDTKGEMQRFGLGGVKQGLDYKPSVDDKKNDNVKRALALLEKYQDKLRSINDEMRKSEGLDSPLLSMKSLIAQDKDFKVMSDAQKTALIDAAELLGITKALALEDKERTEGLAQVAAESAAWKSKDIADSVVLRDKLLDLIDPLRQIQRENAEIADQIKIGWLTQAEGKLASLPSRLRGLLEPAKTDFQILNEALKEGDISWEKYLETIERISPKLQETNDFAKQLGLTFSSAFEDAVIGGKKFRDVLTGIGQDIARILLRKNVTEPLANAIGKFDFGSLLKGVLTGFSGPGLVGEAVPGQYSLTNPAYAMGTNYVPRTGYALLHQGEAVIPAGQNSGGDVNIYQNIYNDSRADQQSIRHGMAVATQQSVAAVEDVNRRRRR